MLLTHVDTVDCTCRHSVASLHKTWGRRRASPAALQSMLPRHERCSTWVFKIDWIEPTTSYHCQAQPNSQMSAPAYMTCTSVQIQGTDRNWFQCSGEFRYMCSRCGPLQLLILSMLCSPSGFPFRCLHVVMFSTCRQVLTRQIEGPMTLRQGNLAMCQNPGTQVNPRKDVQWMFVHERCGMRCMIWFEAITLFPSFSL